MARLLATRSDAAVMVDWYLELRDFTFKWMSCGSGRQILIARW